MNTIQYTFIYIIASLFSTTAIAQIYSSKQITANEMSLLPNYCQYTQGSKYGFTASGNNHPQAVAWNNTIGPGFLHLHHYCWGLVEIQRAARRSTTAHHKTVLLNSAISNFWYVINNSPEDLILLPEIYNWIGKTELQLKRPEKADAAFTKAIIIKPDYWPPYYYWAEHLNSIKREKDALEVVRTGISSAPNTPQLADLMKRIEKNLKQQ